MPLFFIEVTMGRHVGSPNIDSKLFAAAVAAGESQTEAVYIATHGKTKAPNRRSAKDTGYAHARRPEVRAEIERLKKAAVEKAEVTPEIIAEKYTEIAFSPETRMDLQIQALDRLAKMANMFSDNVNVNHTLTIEDKKNAIRNWLDSIKDGETEKPAEVSGSEQGKMDSREEA